ncbi:MAG: hypothetical protein HKM03_07175 [Steroidobacteraceae bacterium]|nr:hypothetical protein [Steroidobacteraceae bacterium]
MNALVLRLLKDHLRRSVLVWLPLVVLQLFVISMIWMLHGQHLPLVGLLIGVAGALTAMDPGNLVWRSLPLTARDAAAFRWWTTAGVPGLLSTLCFAAVWIDHRQVGWSTPSPAVAVESVLAVWAVLAIPALVPHRRVMRARGFQTRSALLAITALGITLALGLPLLSPAAQPYTWLAIAVGWSLLAASAVHARFANTLHWPDIPAATARTLMSRGGWRVLLWPLARRTAIFALLCLGAITLLRWAFPGVAAVAFLRIAYLSVVLMVSMRLTWLRRGAMNTLRLLPIGVHALALRLTAIGVFPGSLVFLLTAVVNRLFPRVGIDLPLPMLVVSLYCLIFFDLSDEKFNPEVHAADPDGLRKWTPYIQQFIWLPGALGMSAGVPALISLGVWSVWVGWALAGGGLLLCVGSHFALVRRLRIGKHRVSLPQGESRGWAMPSHPDGQAEPASADGVVASLQNHCSSAGRMRPPG